MITVKGLYYSKDHEWVKVDGNKRLLVSPTMHSTLSGEIVYVELPELGTVRGRGRVLRY